MTITNSQVSGYDEGTLLDGTFKREFRNANGTFSPTGRIKFGTESNGGFRNITISNITFDHCRGLALETVDGGWLEDVSVSNITMRDVMNPPIFLRLGRRMRGPEGTPVGELRRVNISNLVAYNADSRYPSIIAGVPDHNIEDVTLSNIRIFYRGGGKKELADVQPPERETNYPEPSMFGDMPAYGFFARHVQGIDFNNVTVNYVDAEMRPPFVLEDVASAKFNNVTGHRTAMVPMFVLRNVSDFNTHGCISVPDMHVDRIVKQTF